MNETIDLTPRQKAILNLLADQAKYTREEISLKIEPIYPASKATLARDLSELLERGKIIAHGRGPSRSYQVAFTHPLLVEVDLDQYFAQDADQRINTSKAFDRDVLDNLSGLISSDEMQGLNQVYRQFSRAETDLDPTILRRELERFVIELSWKSSKIEGNTYSLLDTERLIKEEKEAHGHSKHEAIMILNHKKAFDTILENRGDFQVLSHSLVMELHNVLTKDLDISSGIRTHGVGITGTNYRPPDNKYQIEEIWEHFIQTVNSTQEPLEKALVVVSILPYLQPFADGNKRTARMLANAVLLAHDYFPLSYRSVDENEYKSAQLLFYETCNMYHIKRLFLEQYRFALRTYFV